MTYGSAVVVGESTVVAPADGDIDNFGNRTIAIHSVTAPYDDPTVQGAWGQASGGNTWRFTQGNADDWYGVSGGLGHWEGDFLFGGGFGDWGVEMIDWDVGQYWYPAEIAAAGSLYVRFRTNTVGSAVLAHLDNTQVELTHFNGTINDSWHLVIVMTQKASAGSFQGSVQLGVDRIIKTDWIANAWYTIEVKQAGSTVQARVWADESEAVPAFMVSQAASAAFPWGHDVIDGSELKWEAPSGSLSASGIWTCDTDRIWFVPA